MALLINLCLLSLQKFKKKKHYLHRKQVSIILWVETYAKKANVKIRSTFEGRNIL